MKNIVWFLIITTLLNISFQAQGVVKENVVRPCAEWKTNCSELWCSIYADEIEGDVPTCPPPACARSCENTLLSYDCSWGQWKVHF